LKSVVHLPHIQKVTPPSELCESCESTSQFIATRHTRNGRSLERRLNSSVCETTGYAPIESLNVEERPDLFKQIMKIEPDQRVEDELPTKLLKAYAKMKLKAEKRNKENN
jgi:hypothetical protein